MTEQEQIFQCMIRRLCYWRAHGQTYVAQEFIAKRGLEAKRYRDAANEQYQLGNRGVYGDWREDDQSNQPTQP